MTFYSERIQQKKKCNCKREGSRPLIRAVRIKFYRYALSVSAEIVMDDYGNFFLGWKAIHVQPHRMSSPTERVRLGQLRFRGLVPHMPEIEPVRDFAMFLRTHGRKKPGRQRILFTNYIHTLLGDPDNLLNDNQQLEMAQNRHR